MAVGVGFEPTEGHPSTVFKTAAFDHSASPPKKSRQRDPGGEDALYRCARFNQVTFQPLPLWGRADRCWRARYSAAPRQQEVPPVRQIAG